MHTIIETQNLKKVYRMGEVEVTALDGVSITVNKGDFASVMGPSGSGKTTLLNLMGCLDSPSAGKVLISGRDARALPERELDRLRLLKIGFVFQRINLIPILTALENVELPMELAGTSPRARRAKALQLLAAVGLSPRAGHRPAQLSAGEQQRAGIARALANSPDVILADEPTGNLDSKTSGEIIALLERLNRNSGQTIVLVTHNEEIGSRTDRIIRLRDGKTA
ncbi:MAG: ABC transporter ATP-binding protein [bacterium]